MSADIEHSPTPWEVVDGTEIMAADPEIPMGGTGHVIIADTNLIGPKEPRQAADAEFIVRACNAHDELIAALETAWTAMWVDGNGDPHISIEGFMTIGTALGKVEANHDR